MIRHYRIPYGTDAWKRFRTTGLTGDDCKKYNCPQYISGIGGSELSAVLGFNENMRPIEADIFYWKIGLHKPFDTVSEAMIAGKLEEPLLAKRWQCWDGQQWVDRFEAWMNNDFKNKNKHIFRDCFKPSYYVVNTKFPWLFASPDYRAKRNTRDLIDGSVHKSGFCLEMKFTNQFYVNKWLSPSPYPYIVQAHQQTMIYEEDYMEIVMLVDKKFQVVPIIYDSELAKWILETTYQFWQKVLESRKLVDQLNASIASNDKYKQEELTSLIASNEPEPQGTKAWEEFLKEQYRSEASEALGTDEDYDNAVMDAKLTKLINRAKKEKQLYINRMLARSRELKADKITFDDLGYVKLHPKYYNGIKFIVPEDEIETEFNKINL